ASCERHERPQRSSQRSRRESQLHKTSVVRRPEDDRVFELPCAKYTIKSTNIDNYVAPNTLMAVKEINESFYLHTPSKLTDQRAWRFAMLRMNLEGGVIRWISIPMHSLSSRNS